MPQTTLVTGHSGFIGCHTAKRLLERGDLVVGFDVVNGYYDPGLKRARLALLQASRHAETPRWTYASTSSVIRIGADASAGHGRRAD